MRCTQCETVIAKGQQYKFITMGVEARLKHADPCAEAYIVQVCCLTCDFQPVKTRKFGCDKPKAMADWGAAHVADTFNYDFISPTREYTLRRKLTKLDMLKSWWGCLSDSEQHIVARAYTLSLLPSP